LDQGRFEIIIARIGRTKTVSLGIGGCGFSWNGFVSIVTNPTLG
jgi:hypothetical protein